MHGRDVPSVFKSIQGVQRTRLPDPWARSIPSLDSVITQSRSNEAKDQGYGPKGANEGSRRRYCAFLRSNSSGGDGCCACYQPEAAVARAANQGLAGEVDGKVPKGALIDSSTPAARRRLARNEVTSTRTASLNVSSCRLLLLPAAQASRRRGRLLSASPVVLSKRPKRV